MDKALEQYLAGLTEKKLKTSDNKLIGIAARTADPAWQKSNAEKANKPSTLKTIRDKNLASWADKDSREKRLASQKAYWQSDEGKQKGKEQTSNKVWQDAIAKRSADLSYRKKVSEGKFKPIVTPYGVFESKKTATQQLVDNNLTSRKTCRSVESFLTHALIKDPANYYYISKEDYIMMTGKDHG